MNKITIFLVILLTISACSNSIERLKRVGKEPEFANLDLPALEADEEELERLKSKSEYQKINTRKTNSLWQEGSTKFFHDSRAWRVGDIIRVVVEIKDSANLNNTTQQKRNGKDKIGVPRLFGKEDVVGKILSHRGQAATLVDTSSSRDHTGSGTVSRAEDIKTEIAAMVTKILPNGNLVIQGSQEVRVNSELREVKIAGIIRPKDISSENSVNTNQIAEARISYGGRGIISDVQQPRIGSQIVDIVSPF